MISQEKLRKYVDIIEKYGMKSRISVTIYPDMEAEVIPYVEYCINFTEGFFSVYGCYNSEKFVQLYPTVETETGWGIPPKYALEGAKILKNCALACKEINELRIPFNTYCTLDFVEALKQEYKRRGKRLNIEKIKRG